MKKHLAMLLTLILVSVSLCGCGTLESLTGGTKAKTAQEVVNNYISKETKNNVHADMDMEFNIGIKAEGMTLDMPINMEASIDSVDAYNMYGDMTVDVSMLGMSNSVNTEMYISHDKENDELKIYMFDSNTNEWHLTDDVNTKKTLDALIKLDEDLFENATMKYDRKMKTYVVTQPFEDFKTSESYGITNEMSDISDGALDSLGLEQDIIDDIYKNAKVIYTFDKEYNILSMELVGTEYSGTVSEGGQTADITFEISLSVTYSNHGQVKLSDVEVPQEVKDTAIEQNNLDGDFGGFEEDQMFSYDKDKNEMIDPEFSFDGEGNTDGEDNLGIEPNTQNIKPGSLGTINNVNFTGNGDSWDSTFGADGWVLENNEDNFSFITATNTKYDKYGELYIYNKELEGTTKEDIMNDGIFGYDIDFGNADISVIPNITWQGLTFGATVEEIIATYGEPSYEYNGTMYDSYTYEIADRTEIEFQVYDEEGLKSVRVSVYPEY